MIEKEELLFIFGILTGRLRKIETSLLLGEIGHALQEVRLAQLDSKPYIKKIYDNPNDKEDYKNKMEGSS